MCSTNASWDHVMCWALAEVWVKAVGRFMQQSVLQQYSFSLRGMKGMSGCIAHAVASKCDQGNLTACTCANRGGVIFNRTRSSQQITQAVSLLLSGPAKTRQIMMLLQRGCVASRALLAPRDMLRHRQLQQYQALSASAPAGAAQTALEAETDVIVK